MDDLFTQRNPYSKSAFHFCNLFEIPVSKKKQLKKKELNDGKRKTERVASCYDRASQSLGWYSASTLMF